MALDIGKQVLHWRRGADEALSAAQLLIENGRYNFGLFFLHLALEKALKALVALRIRDVPPKTHNLVFLSERAELAPPPDVLVTLGEFQAYCMAGRYPDAEPAAVDRTLAQGELSRAKEAYTWLQTQFDK